MTTLTIESPITKVFRSKLESARKSDIDTGSCGCSHSWILQRADHPDNDTGEDRILVHKQDGHAAHARIWGDWAWHVQFRGYYHENKMAISAHSYDSDELARLESLVVREFKKQGLEIIYASWS
jgi:hypothetical protein